MQAASGARLIGGVVLGNELQKGIEDYSMRWAFEVERTGLERRNLIDLVESLGYKAVEVPGHQIVFRSDSMEAYSTPGEVWEQAKCLRELMVSVTEIDKEFAIGAVLDMSSEPPKRNIFLEVEPIIMKVTMGSPTLTVLPPLGLSEDQLAEWTKHKAEQEYQSTLEAQKAKLVPAFREPRAAKLLQLLKQKSHTGESLYKIYELAEGHPSQRKTFQNQFGISDVDFKRFADAVHNPVVSGSLARHAYEDTPKTPNPMSMREAQSFAVGLAMRWLASVRG
ncbi:hypothetical protein CKO35_10710 [Ectothiorhodospira shaposhnikovii]|uniref:hypothetical protein n=1 Tax=Ectothiorhodospira shaposhnikovii TaxID=1054 RepID=UPI001907CBB7|nr:hypothetical protein [Ectothiorhodospira shaposhnikovii]MBK1673767.1 hypothetical protein [Ectothiorhodospira shaposhnikovii]